MEHLRGALQKVQPMLQAAHAFRGCRHLHWWHACSCHAPCYCTWPKEMMSHFHCLWLIGNFMGHVHIDDAALHLCRNCMSLQHFHSGLCDPVSKCCHRCSWGLGHLHDEPSNMSLSKWASMLLKTVVWNGPWVWWVKLQSQQPKQICGRGGTGERGRGRQCGIAKNMHAWTSMQYGLPTAWVDALSLLVQNTWVPPHMQLGAPSA